MKSRIKNILTILIISLIPAIVPAQGEQVSAVATFKATLGKPMNIMAETQSGELGIIIAGDVKDLSQLPIEQRSARFSISGESLANFTAGGQVQTESGGISIGDIVWEYYNFETQVWEAVSASGNGDFSSSQNLKLDDNGNALLRVYPNSMRASDEANAEEGTERFFQVTLSCSYTNI